MYLQRSFQYCTLCELVNKHIINEEFFILQFTWNHSIPKAGQFFMLKPPRCSTFLPRPIGVFEYNENQKQVKFLISKRGKGTIELSHVAVGEKVQLTGPLGNSWADFLPDAGNIALVSGSAGVAPLAALVAERPEFNYYFFAGFRQGFREKDEEDAILGAAVKSKKVVVTAEDGRNALIGKIVDFIFEPQKFDMILGCGPAPMLNALKKKCAPKGIPCFISMESRLACGVGACHGCAVKTVKGFKRCCKDGPIFSAGDVIFDE